MQTSDQSPEEQPVSPQAPQAPANSSSPQSQDESSHAISKQSMPGMAGVNDDAIRQGLVYPPPPSFYQKEQQAPSTQTGLPPQQPPYTYGGPAEYVSPPQPGNTAQTPQAPYFPPPPYAPYPPYPPGLGYPGMPAPYFAPAPPTAKKSYKWVWILVSALGVILLASCGVCAWAASPLIGNAFQQANSVVYGGRDITNNYYEAIQNQHYSQAYSYIYSQQSLNGLTLDQYQKQAQALDEQYGPVYKYIPGTPAISYNTDTNTSSTTIDHFTIKVDVTRKKKSYQVLLTMYKINNQWKITKYTTI